jgi:drug/metabolite transporter (DMT)-like permease
VAAVLGGLGAALLWSIGTTFASRAARAMGSMLTLAWVMLVGLVALALVLPFSGSAHISGTSALWLFLGGAGNVAGLLLMYHSLRIGQMGVVMPIVSTEGGIAALIAILAGQTVGGVRGAALALTVVGVIMTALARRPSDPDPAVAALAAGDEPAPGHRDSVPTPQGHGDRRAALWALVAALSFGISLYGTGRAGEVLPTAWAVMPPRVIGVLAITLPLLLRGELRIPRGTAHLLVVAGLCEVAGFFSYATGASHSIPVAAVLATLTGAFGAGFGRLLFGERLQNTQVVGIVVIFIGVATISAIT